MLAKKVPAGMPVVVSWGVVSQAMGLYMFGTPMDHDVLQSGCPFPNLVDELHLSLLPGPYTRSLNICPDTLTRMDFESPVQNLELVTASELAGIEPDLCKACHIMWGNRVYDKTSEAMNFIN